MAELSSNDRAEKAARAKDRLKKFQAKKKAGESTSSLAPVDSKSEIDHSHTSPNTEPSIQPQTPISQNENQEFDSVPINQVLSPLLVSPEVQGNQKTEVELMNSVSQLSESGQQTISLLENEKNILMNQLDDSRQEISNLKQALANAEKESSSQIEKLNQDLEETQSKFKHVQYKLDESLNSGDALQSDFKSTQAQIEEMSHSHERSQDEIIQKFESKLKIVQNHSDEIETELSKAKDLLKSHEDRKPEQERKIERLEKENLACQERLIESQNTALSINATLDTLQQNHQQLLAETLAKDGQLKDISEKFNGLKSYSDSLKTQLDKFETSQESLSLIVSQLEQKLSENNLRSNALQEENQHLLQNLADLKLQIVELTDQKIQSSDHQEDILKVVQEREAELNELRDQLLNQRQSHEKQKEQFESDENIIKQELARTQQELNAIKVSSDEERVSLQQQLALHSEKSEQLRLESQSLFQQLQESNSFLEQSRQDVNLAIKNQTETNSQLIEKSASLFAAVAREQQLKDQLDSLSSTLNLERDQNKELEKITQDSRNMISQMQTEIGSLENNLKQTVLKAEEQEKRHEAQLAQITNLESENQNLTSQLSLLSTESTSLQEKIQENFANTSEIQAMLNAKTLESDQLLTSLNQERDRVIKVEALLVESKSSIKNLTSQLEDSQTSYEALVADHAKHLEDVTKQFNESSEQLSQQVKQLQIQYQDSQMRLKDTEDSRVGLTDKLSRLEHELSSSKNSVKTLQSSVASINNDREEIRVAFDQKNRELEELKNSMNHEKTQHDFLMKELQKNLENKNLSLKTSEGKLSSILEENERFKKDLEESQSDLSQQKQNLASALHDLVTVKNTLEDMEDQHSLAKVENEKLLISKEAVEAELKNYREKMSTTLSNLQAELLSCKKCIDLQEEQMSQSNQRNSELKEELNLIEQEKSVLIKEMEKGKEGENRILEKSRLEILDLKEKLHQLKEEREVMKQDLSQTKSEFEQNDQVKEDEIHRLNNELKRLKQLEMESMKSREKAIEERNDGIKKNSELNQALESIREDNEDLQNALEEHQRKTEKLKDELSAQITDLTNQLEARKGEQESQAITSHQTILSKTRELEDQQKALEACKDEHQKAQNISTQIILKLEEELDGMKLRHEQMVVEKEQFQQEIQESGSQQASQFTEELGRKEVEIKRIETLLTSKSEEYELNERELNEMKIEFEKLEKELEISRENHSSVVSQLEVELKDLKARLGNQKELKVDQDYVDSIIQQHQIDLSTARSQIRALENRIFEEESRSHEMLTRVENLQDQLRGAEEALQEAKKTTINPIKRISTGMNDELNDSKVSLVLNSKGMNSSELNSKINFSKMMDDSNLSDQTKLDRKESLKILKTRMESELGLSSLIYNERNWVNEGVELSREQETRREDNNSKKDQNQRDKFISRSKLGDDMVWCGDCVGDLFMI